MKIRKFDKKAEKEAIKFVNDNFEKGKYYNFRNALNINDIFSDVYGKTLGEVKIKPEYEAIIEFKKYRILCRTTDKNTKIDDCDMCEMVMYLWCLWLKNKGYDNLEFSGRTIKVKKDDFSLEIETDTVNSLDTILNNFLRSIIIKEDSTSLLKLYQNNKDLAINKNGELTLCKGLLYTNMNDNNMDNRRDLWVIKNLNVIYEYCQKQNNSALLLALNRWAELTHTFGNFMIGPKGFNSKGFSHSNAKLPYNMFGDKVKGESIEVFFRQLQSIKKQMDEYLKLEHMDIYFEGNNPDIWKNPVKRLGYVGKDENGEEKYNEIERINAICNLIEQRNDLFYDDFKDIVKKENVE